VELKYPDYKSGLKSLFEQEFKKKKIDLFWL
jgi:hypothetical protein